MKNLTRKQISYIVGLSMVLLLVGFVSGYIFRLKTISQYINNFKPYRVNPEGYLFINPLVGIESPSSLTVGLNLPLYTKLEQVSYSYMHERGMQDFAIYYRDLNSSSWFGINEDKEFIPASLLKISFAIAAYKENEDSGGFLNKKVMYTESLASINKKVTGALPTGLIIGNTYTVLELIKIMIVNSDNGARDILAATINPKYVSDLYKLFGSSNPDSKKTFTISTKDYSLFLRILYSATYLTNADSDQLLSYLSQADFTQGIIAGLPSDVKAAHKYGMFDSFDSNNQEMYKELHDCGVVYEATHPYVLCVMTKGKDEKVLEEFIATVSQEVYNYTFTKK
jgi:beta-lactamase class A